MSGKMSQTNASIRRYLKAACLARTPRDVIVGRMRFQSLIIGVIFRALKALKIELCNKSPKITLKSGENIFNKPNFYSDSFA